MMGRITILPSTTTARSLIECMPGEASEVSSVSRRWNGKGRTEDGTLGSVDDGSAVEGSENTSVGAAIAKRRVSLMVGENAQMRAKTHMVKDPPAISSSVSLLSLACTNALVSLRAPHRIP